MLSKPIRLQPKQAMFDWLMENSLASWMGYGGSRGGSKSACARRVMVRRRLTYPGTNGLIMRRVWDDVLKNHVLEMWKDFPELRELYNAQEKCIYLPNNSKIFFGSAEVKADVDRQAYGPEFMDIMVDQAEQFTEDELKQIKTTCRWVGMPMHACKFGLYFNPGGVSAGFLQRVFHLKEYHEREIPEDFVFMQAYGWDNACWALASLKEDGLTEADYYKWSSQQRFQYYITRTQYGREMNALDANKRPGQLLGDFQKFAGQYFSNLNRDVHVWAREDIIFQSHWPRWISIDWGFQHHTSVGWFCQAGLITEDGKVRPLTILYKHLLKQGLSERALAEEICAYNNEDHVDNIFAGHDLWKKESNSLTKESAMSQVFRAHGLPSLKKAVIDRVDGWRLVHRMLDEGEFIMTDNCNDVFMALSTLVYDEKKQNEDVLKAVTKEDDIADMVRYGLASQFAPQREPEALQMQREVAHLTDPTMRNIYMLKKLSENEANSRRNGMVNTRSVGRFARYAQRWNRM
jgi:phage terminase large subunit